MTERAPTSPLRRKYMARLVLRIITFFLCIFIFLKAPGQFDILQGFDFFKKPSLLHLLWLAWVVDMLEQVIPAKSHIALGSQKHFAFRFRPIKEKLNKERLKEYVVATTKSAYTVFLLWLVLTLAIGYLFLRGIISIEIVVLISVFFYVCDLICVLIWCPFRLMMKTRCYTTCRIFNWDHLMMFSPMIFVGGFYCLSLFFLSLLVFVVWEVCIFLHPERFWEITNTALRCSECTDKLCTQYCQKLRPKKEP